jgi:hypothetical protein
VLGRFNSLIVDIISLFVRFISLFGRVGNLHSGVSQYQSLAGQVRSLDGPESGFSQYISVDQGTRSRPTYSATKPFDPTIDHMVPLSPGTASLYHPPKRTGGTANACSCR